MPARDGVFAVSTRPARNVKQPTTPITPAITPTRAERTGTARVPRPGSTASREPISRAGGSPARNVHSPTGLGIGRVGIAVGNPPLRGRDRHPEHDETEREDAEAEHGPVGVRADVEIDAAGEPDRKSRRQGECDDERGPAPTTAVSAAGNTSAPAAMPRSAPIARHVGRSAGAGGDRAHQGLTGEDDSAQDDREREQQQPVVARRR